MYAEIMKDLVALALQLSPVVAAKVLEWLKRFEAGPFKALQFTGVKGKVVKWVLSAALGAVIAALSQVVGEQVGVTEIVPTVKTLATGAGYGLAAALGYGIARPKMPHTV